MSETISTALSHGITLNSGSYGSALLITNTGGVDGLAGPAGAYLVAPGAGGIGITTNGPASITNAGLILGGTGGVGELYAPTLMVGELFFTYFVGAGGPGAEGGLALYSGAALMLSNSGSIIGGAGGAGGPDEKPGNGGTGAAAVTGGAGSTVVNTGVIQGGNGGPMGASNGIWVAQGGIGGDGVDLTSGLVINAGTIAGGYPTFNATTAPAYALSFSGIGTLEVEAGAAFMGSVVAAVGSTLDLAGTADGSLDLGGSFTGFSEISFAPGLFWTLEGDASELAAGQIISGFSAGDKIILPGLSLTSETYIAHTGLVLNNTLTLAITNTALGLRAENGSGNVVIMAPAPETISSTSAGITFGGNQLTITSSGEAIGSPGSPGIYPQTMAGTAITNLYSATIFNAGSIVGGDGGVGESGAGAQWDWPDQVPGGQGFVGGAAGYGILTQAALTLTNTGDIIGGTGGNGGLGGGSYTGTWYHDGLKAPLDIPGGQGGNGGRGGAAIVAGAGSVLFNQGVIAGGNGGAGAKAYGGAGGGSAGPAGAGIILAGGLITNAGTISGGGSDGSGYGFAIYCTGYSTLVVDAGAVFVGGVVANAGGYLELGGAMPGALNMAGAFTGFDRIGFASIAAWTLAGTAGELLSGETISHFGQQDAIDIIGATISRYVISNDSVVFFDSGAVLGTLELSGANIPVGDSFIAFNDGHGGIEVALAAPSTTTLATGSLDSAPTIGLAATLTALPGATIASPTLNGGTLELESGSTLLGNIAFTGTAGRLILDGPPPANLITGFTQGDTIELANVTYSPTDTATVATAGTLTIDAGGATYALNIAGAYVGESFALSGDLIIEATCFCPGTRIATARGAKKVENLRIGALIKTTTAGLQPIKWIGRRRYAAPFCNHAKILPIRVAAGALAAGVPRRDLFVSPGHALSLEGQLVHAGRLVNGVSITQADSAALVDYIHIELAAHAIILAENTPVETFRDESFRAQFQNAAEYHWLYPGSAAPEAPCQPLLREGFALFALHRRLARRAGMDVPLHSTGPLRGCLDEAGPHRLRGWAQDITAPEHPVSLMILAGGAYAGQVLANLYREDLHKAGLGSGHHAFDIALPAGSTGPITVHRSADGAAVAAPSCAA